ncbi:MAG: hypothetical protein HC861_09795 [Rhodospirillaceae bacterium]|nr:hypothetical protein [Rhodospirillaceae bacterium]
MVLIAWTFAPSARPLTDGLPSTQPRFAIRDLRHPHPVRPVPAYPNRRPCMLLPARARHRRTAESGQRLCARPPMTNAMLLEDRSDG